MRSYWQTERRDSRNPGAGADESSRFSKIAIEQAQEKMEGAVLASDAYFPMDDSVEYAAKHGIKAIIQPGGSIKRPRFY